MKERAGMPYDVVAFEADELARHLTIAEEGIFHRMLRLAWMNGSVPADLTALADLCRIRPSTMRKAWPALAPLWENSPADPTRLRNKKQESERIFLELKRNAAREAGKISAKAQKARREAVTTVKRPLNDRSTPLPSPPLSSTSVEDNKTLHSNRPVHSPAEAGQGDRKTSTPCEKDLAYELFAAEHQKQTGAAYLHKKGDFVRLAELRKANGVDGRGIPEKWEEAITNYFASPCFSQYTLADLCSRFPLLRNSPLDEFKHPVNHGGNNNGRHLDKQQRNAETARRLLLKLHPENRGGILDRPIGIDPGGVPGAAPKADGK